MMGRAGGLALVLWLGLTTMALAIADGPDFYRVVGVAADDRLNIRAEAHAGADILGWIPHDGHGIRNLGCVGRLTYAQWEAATEAERAAARNRVWCRIEYDGVTGWSVGRYLAE